MKKLAYETEPVTLTMLMKGELKVGDDVVSTITMLKPNTTDEYVLHENEEYKVVDINPPTEAPGFVLNTEVGKWLFTFEKYGGAWFFEKVVSITEEDELGELGTIPYDILQLIKKKSGIKRKEILDYLSYRSEAGSAKQRADIRNNILNSLRFLESREYIEPARGKLDEYSITIKGYTLLGLVPGKNKTSGD